jgi:hypothetical protein
VINSATHRERSADGVRQEIANPVDRNVGGRIGIDL